jgi:hypothetical protein
VYIKIFGVVAIGAVFVEGVNCIAVLLPSARGAVGSVRQAHRSGLGCKLQDAVAGAKVVHQIGKFVTRTVHGHTPWALCF